MSLFNTLNTGATGMGASSTTLAVIGDNIANIGTNGFKSAHASFLDNLPSTVVTGLGGIAQVGAGAGVGQVALDFQQGAIQQSANAIDVAIIGNGFFEVAAGAERFYTRDGTFHMDADNYIVNSAGLRLQGYQAVNDTVTTSLGDIQVDPGGIPQRVTSTVTLTATLSADADATDEPFDAIRTATPLDGTAGAPTFDALSQATDFATSNTVYDSLGLAHTLTLFFERSSAAPDTWNIYAVVDGGEVDTDGDGLADGVPGAAYEIGSGTVQFDADGVLIANSGITINAGWTFPGSNAFAPTFEFGLDPLGAATDGELRMTGSESYLTTVSQDGYAAGILDGLRVGGDGTIVGRYTNGQEQLLGQIAIATFPSNAGLERVGGNLFAATDASGAPAMGVPGVGGRGATSGYSVEGSNVDLEEQFVSMIQAQRSYQANTGVIRTADEALQQLIQLV